METGIVKMDVQALIATGLEKGANVDVMERLYALAKDMKAIRAKEMFYESLKDFQKNTAAIKKTKGVKNKSEKVIYAYAPLEDIVNQVKDNLDKYGFSYTLKTKQENGFMTVTCEAHHVEGHTEFTDVTVPVGSEYMTAQQQVGAALTFAKRYAFCDAFGILTADEDTDAVEPEAKQEKKPDAPKFPKEEHKPSETYKTVFENVKKTFDSMTGTLSKEGAAVAFKDTCKAIWGEKKYYNPIERFTVDELNQFYAQIMTGAK